MLFRHPEAAERCFLQFLIFITLPHPRSYGVDDVPCWKISPARNRRGSYGYFTAPCLQPHVALLLNRLAPLSKDGTGHTRAVRQLRIGRIDDGIHFHFGNIPLYQLDNRVTEPLLHP